MQPNAAPLPRAPGRRGPSRPVLEAAARRKSRAFPPRRTSDRSGVRCEYRDGICGSLGGPDCGSARASGLGSRDPPTWFPHRRSRARRNGAAGAGLYRAVSLENQRRIHAKAISLHELTDLATVQPLAPKLRGTAQGLPTRFANPRIICNLEDQPLGMWRADY